ncbi:MAG: PilZ domain-containing protein [Rhizobiales bacterium]|nr:PilZ domain-containing protein [Hyphomicrobiales bacterium]
MTDADKRVAARKRVLKGARIVYNDRSSTLSCTVRDLSDTGARLRVPQGQAVPSQFDLLIDVDGFEAPCTVVWRRGEEVGVTFDAPPTVNAAKRAQVVTAIDRAPVSIRRKPIQ